MIDNENVADVNWHDSKIYSIGFDNVNHKLLFDADLITSWKKHPENENYEIYIAPVTIIFNNVWNVIFDIEMMNISLDLDDVNSSNPTYSKNYPDILEYDWKMEFRQGEINFKSIGFKIIFRDDPKIDIPHERSFTNRNGISFV